jgi:hypothetical protein
LIHLKALTIQVCERLGKIRRRQAMTGPNMLAIIIGVFAFAAFATTLAWAQLHARPACAPTQVAHAKRRPF